MMEYKRYLDTRRLKSNNLIYYFQTSEFLFLFLVCPGKLFNRRTYLKYLPKSVTRVPGVEARLDPIFRN